MSNSAGVVTWTVNSLANNAVASLALVVRANSVGAITNAAAVVTGTTDLNPDDDRASAVVAVVSPTADLALSLVGLPDPMLLGDYLTYSITISNGGPATATGVVVVDALPPVVSFVSASPANSYTFAGGVVTFTNLGNLGSGAQTSVTIVVQPTAAGTIMTRLPAAPTSSIPLRRIIRRPSRPSFNRKLNQSHSAFCLSIIAC